MALYAYHGVGYMVYWLIRGIDVFVEEMTDWLDCGKCTHINNLAGVISWAGGFLLWLTSLKWARRKNYALFFTTHQLHLVFFGFGCIHWPTCLAYAAPSIVFYAADLALRMHISRKGVEAIARVRPSLKEPTMTTLVIARSGDAPTAPRPADCPHGVEMVAKSASGTCPAKGSRANETPDDGEDWSGGCVYLAVQSSAACHTCSGTHSASAAPPITVNPSSFTSESAKDGPSGCRSSRRSQQRRPEALEQREETLRSARRMATGRCVSA